MDFYSKELWEKAMKQPTGIDKAVSLFEFIPSEMNSFAGVLWSTQKRLDDMVDKLLWLVNYQKHGDDLTKTPSLKEEIPKLHKESTDLLYTVESIGRQFWEFNKRISQIDMVVFNTKLKEMSDEEKKTAKEKKQ